MGVVARASVLVRTLDSYFVQRVFVVGAGSRHLFLCDQLISEQLFTTGQFLTEGFKILSTRRETGRETRIFSCCFCYQLTGFDDAALNETLTIGIARDF